MLRYAGLQAQSVYLHTSIKIDFLLEIHKWNSDALCRLQSTHANDFRVQELTCLSSPNDSGEINMYGVMTIFSCIWRRR